MYGLSNICSLCLVRNQNLINIVSQDTDGTVVEEKLRIFLLELIHFKPYIQKYICSKCLSILNNIYTFRLKWLENITALNEYVQKLEENEPNIKLSVTVSDIKYGKEVSLELENQYHNKTSENELQNNCPQGNVTQDRVFITKEIADIKNVSTENTNFVQENSQTNLPIDVKIEIDKAQEISLQDNVVKQSIDEHVEENFFEDNNSMKIEHEDTFNNLQTPYKIFEEFNEEKHIVEEDENITNYISTSDLKSTDGRSQKSYKCDKCNKAYKDKSALITHKRSYFSEKRFKCNVCDKKFMHKGHFISHKLTHTGEKPYKCDICDFKSRHKNSLTRHKVKHSGVKPHQCDVCDKRFGLKASLISHKVEHSGVKPHQCDVCDKRFGLKASLISHKFIHSGMKPYKCDLCDYKSHDKSNLKRHKDNIHSKPHQCDVCDKRFGLKASLISHKVEHSGVKPHQCDVCDKRFGLKASLISHKVEHSGMKPYKCDLCDYKSHDKSNLKRHKDNIHSKPHQCDVCDKRFGRRAIMIRHKLVHTGN